MHMVILPGEFDQALENLEWPTLVETRWVTKVTMLFKILNDIACIPAHQYLVSISNTGRRHQQRLKLKQDPFSMSMHS